MDITEELKAKAMACTTAEELLALAAENEVELTSEEAELILEDMHEAPEGELADEELDNVAGGAEGCKPPNTYELVVHPEGQPQYLFNVGDQVQALAKGCKHHTATCIVRNLGSEKAWHISHDGCHGHVIGCYDTYYLEKAPGTKSVFSAGWYNRSRIEK